MPIKKRKVLLVLCKFRSYLTRQHVCYQHLTIWFRSHLWICYLCFVFCLPNLADYLGEYVHFIIILCSSFHRGALRVLGSVRVNFVYMYLKGQCNMSIHLQFVGQSKPPGALTNGLIYFRFWVKNFTEKTYCIPRSLRLQEIGHFSLNL